MTKEQIHYALLPFTIWNVKGMRFGACFTIPRRLIWLCIRSSMELIVYVVFTIVIGVHLVIRAVGVESLRVICRVDPSLFSETQERQVQNRDRFRITSGDPLDFLDSRACRNDDSLAKRISRINIFNQTMGIVKLIVLSHLFFNEAGVLCILRRASIT